MFNLQLRRDFTGVTAVALLGHSLIKISAWYHSQADIRIYGYITLTLTNATCLSIYCHPFGRARITCRVGSTFKSFFCFSHCYQSPNFDVTKIICLLYLVGGSKGITSQSDSDIDRCLIDDERITPRTIMETR